MARVLSEDAFSRTRAAVEYVEGLPRDETAGATRRMPTVYPMVIGTLDGALAASGSQTVTVKYSNSSGVLTAKAGLTSATVYDVTSTARASGDVVHAIKYGEKFIVVGPGGACVARNEIWHVTIAGGPTGGTFALQVNVNGTSESKTFNYNDNAAAVDTVLDTHAEIANGDVTVTGGALPNVTVVIEFTGDLAATDIVAGGAAPYADWSSLTGGSGVSVTITRFQNGLAG